MFVIQVAATIVLSTLMEASFRGRDFVLVRLNLRWWAEILVVCKGNKHEWLQEMHTSRAADTRFREMILNVR